MTPSLLEGWYAEMAKGSEGKKARVAAIAKWLRMHPEGTATGCMAELGDLGAKKSAFYSAFREAQIMMQPPKTDDPEEEERQSAETRRHAGGRPPENAGRTERMTIMMTPTTKRLLRRMCADDDVTAAEWIEKIVADIYPEYEG